MLVENKQVVYHIRVVIPLNKSQKAIEELEATLRAYDDVIYEIESIEMRDKPSQTDWR